MDADGDARVVLTDAVEVVGLGDDVGPARRLQRNGDNVGRVGLVDRDETLLEHANRALQADAKLGELLLARQELGGRAIELGLAGGELLLDGGLALAQRRLLADQLVDLAVGRGDRRGDIALLGADLAELGLGLLDALRTSAGERAEDGKGRAGCENQRRQDSAKGSGQAIQGSGLPPIVSKS